MSASPQTKQGYRCVDGAWLHRTARIADGVEMAPGALIGADVEIGAGCRVGPNAVILGPARLGRDNVVHASAVLGGAPQDIRYAGEPTRLEIGDGNVFREGVTVSRGAPKSGGLTSIGSRNFVMAMSHIGHDCVVEDDCILANGVLLAGHCHLQNGVNLAGNVALVQFTTVGRLAFVGGRASVRKDLEPFMIHDQVRGSSAVRALSVNAIGLRRAGMPDATIARLRRAHRILFRDSSGFSNPATRQALADADALCPEVDELLEFLDRKAAGRSGRQLDGARRCDPPGPTIAR